MSNIIKKTVACPVCGDETEIQVCKTLNAATDPDLRDRLLGGELLHFKCGKCGCDADLQYPLLYNDIVNQFMVYYIPDVDREYLTDEKLEEEYGGIDGITRRIVGSANELKEKIHVFESGLDDRVIEVVKAALRDVVEKRTEDTVSEGYFSKYSQSEGKIGFTFFVGEDSEQFVQTTRLEIYDRSADVVKAFDGSTTDTDSRFKNINRSWARNAIYNYRTKK